MSTAWRYTAMILAGSALLLVAGLFSLRMAAAVAGTPRGLAETRKILGQLGGEAGLATHKTRLTAFRDQLRQAQAAHLSDAGAFSRRIEETFAELGLTLAASSEWQPVPKVKIPGGAPFERTFTGTGPFAELLDAVATIESWPDEARVRELTLTRHGQGEVAFTLKLAVVRTVPQEGH